MFDYNSHTKIIDTPGIKGFGLVDFDKGRISNLFSRNAINIKAL